MKYAKLALAIAVVVLFSGILPKSVIDIEKYIPSTPTQPKPPEPTPPEWDEVDCDWSTLKEVSDGDTILTKRGKIRLIGIDTPEVDGPYRKAEPFGEEASARMKELLRGEEKVCLSRDSNVDNKDQYGRYLRYVYREDGTLVNEVMVAEGLAEVTNYGPFAYRSVFRSHQKAAKASGLGLWAK